ncbi:type IV pilus biogenesis protein PilP [Acidithiobacillus caldus]
MSRKVFANTGFVLDRAAKRLPVVLAVSTVIVFSMAGAKAWAGPLPSPSAPISSSQSGSSSSGEPVFSGDEGSSSVTLAELARAQNEAALLRVQLDIAKLKEEIRKAKEGKSVNQNGSAPKPYFTPSIPSEQSAFEQVLSKAHKTGMPKVLSIYGKGNRQDVAELALPNGGTVLARAGMNLAPYGRVERISGDGVYFLAHGKRRVLPIAVSGGAIANVSDVGNTFASPGAIPTLNPPAPIASAPQNFGPPPSNVSSVPPMLPGKGD